MEQLPELTKKAFRVRSHLFHLGRGQGPRCQPPRSKVASPRKSNATVSQFTGKMDRLIPWQDTQRLANEASGPVELMIVEDGNHIANHRPYRYRYPQRRTDRQSSSGLPAINSPQQGRHA
jgi:2,6-dihydroxypseudooxynicotine hydrolase